MESYNEEEKGLIMRVVKEIIYNPERIPRNLWYIHRRYREDQQDCTSHKNCNNYRIKLCTTCCWQYCYWDGGLQKHLDGRKQATKLVTKNFREAQGITQRVRTIKQNETKGIAISRCHIKAWKEINCKIERCWNGSRRRSTEVICCWGKARKIWQ